MKNGFIEMSISLIHFNQNMQPVFANSPVIGNGSTGAILTGFIDSTQLNPFPQINSQS